MKKLILLFIAFVTLSNYSYSQGYADLRVYGFNRTSNQFNARFEWTSSEAPIQGIRMRGKDPNFSFNMTVVEFIKQMHLQGWEVQCFSASGSGKPNSVTQYLFRKE